MTAVGNAAVAAGVLALYILVGATRHVDMLFVGLNAEDAVWISGSLIGSGVRFTSHYLLHELGLGIFGEQVMGYRLLSVGLHIINAYLLFWTYLLAAPGSLAPTRARPVALQGGALLAGLLFLLTQMFTMQWLAALAYQVLVLFTLLTMVMAQVHFRTGWLWPWALSAVAYHLALNSHSFALFLPLMIALMERADASPRRSPFNPLLALARYSLYALVLFRFFLVNWKSLFDAGEAGIAAPEFWSTLVRRAVDVLQARLNTAATAPYFGVDIEYQFPTWPPVVVAMCLLAFGLHQALSGHRRPGLLGFFALFVLTMGAITLPQEVVAPVLGAHWRSYPLAAMVAMVLALSLTRVLEGLTRLSPGSSRRTLQLLFLLAGAGVLVANEHVTMGNLTRVVSPATRWQQKGDWNPPAGCKELEHLTRAEAATRLASSRGLRCVDLNNRDLTGLPLAGVDLTGARLTGANLNRVDLREARLDGGCLFLADLRGADLRGAALMGADLRQADLAGASLHWTKMGGGDLRGANLDRTVMVETRFEEADLRGVDLSRATISSYNLDAARLDGTRFPRWMGGGRPEEAP